MEREVYQYQLSSIEKMELIADWNRPNVDGSIIRLVYDEAEDTESVRQQISEELKFLLDNDMIPDFSRVINDYYYFETSTVLFMERDNPSMQVLTYDVYFTLEDYLAEGKERYSYLTLTMDAETGQIFSIYYDQDGNELTGAFDARTLPGAWAEYWGLNFAGAHEEDDYYCAEDGYGRRLDYICAASDSTFLVYPETTAVKTVEDTEITVMDGSY